MPRMNHIPESPEDLTAQWLSDALRQNKIMDKAEITSLQMSPIGEAQGFTGFLYKVELEYDKHEAKAPASLIAKFASADPELRETMKTANIREINFYKDFVKGQSLPVVDCYYSDVDIETGASIVLLQDLSRMRTVEFLEGCTVEDAESVVRALAQFHSKWWDNSSLDDLDYLLTLQDFPIEELWEQYPSAIKAILPDFTIPESLRIAGEHFSSNLQTIVNRLEGKPTTIIHRDIHVDNVLFATSASDFPAVLLDWQAVGRGLGISDVAYFLISSLPTPQRRQSEEDLVHMYQDMLLEAGIRNYSFEQCWSDYKFSAVTKFLFSVFATVFVDNSGEYRQAWRRADIQRLIAFIEDHHVHEML